MKIYIKIIFENHYVPVYLLIVDLIIGDRSIKILKRTDLHKKYAGLYLITTCSCITMSFCFLGLFSGVLPQ